MGFLEIVLPDTSDQAGQIYAGQGYNLSRVFDHTLPKVRVYKRFMGFCLKYTI